MKTARLNIDISRDVYSTLEIEGYTKRKLEKDVKQRLAIDLFSEGILSFGKAAELASMNKWQFMELLKEKKIPFYELTDEEMKDEYKLANRLYEGIKCGDRK